MLVRNCWRSAAALWLAASAARAQVNYDIPQDDLDLFNFISVSCGSISKFQSCLTRRILTFSGQRPDLRAPKYNITTTANSTPGYIFVAPYTDLLAHAATRLYEPSQLGPAIYDQDGVRHRHVTTFNPYHPY